MIPFSVNLREEDGKLIGIFFSCLFPHHLAESNVGEEAYGDIKVDVSADDFFAIYNGEVGASQLASMILSGRVYVRRFKYKQVSDFASSFDFSSHKWEEFYEMKGIHYPGYEHNDDQDGTKSAEQLVFFSVGPWPIGWRVQWDRGSTSSISIFTFFLTK